MMNWWCLISWSMIRIKHDADNPVGDSVQCWQTLGRLLRNRGRRCEKLRRLESEFLLAGSSEKKYFLFFWSSHVRKEIGSTLTSTLFLSFSSPSLDTLWCLLIMSLGCFALKGYAIDLEIKFRWYDRWLEGDNWSRLLILWPENEDVELNSLFPLLLLLALFFLQCRSVQ